MLRVHPIIAALCALCVMHSAALAQEQPSPDTDTDKARQHYAKAEQAVLAGDFALAAAEYRAAHEITKDAALLFKIGDAQERAGDCESALVFYRRYLVEGAPKEQLLQATQERIDACLNKASAPTDANHAAGAGHTDTGHTDTGHTGIDSAGGGAPAESTPEPDPATETSVSDAAGASAPSEPVAEPMVSPPSFIDQKPSWQRNAAWLSIGITVSLATAGAVLSLSASSREEDIENLIRFRYPNGEPAEYTGNARAQYEELIDEGKSLATWSRVTLAAAGLSAATAVAFFILDAKSGGGERNIAHIVPAVSWDSVGVSAGWCF